MAMHLLKIGVGHLCLGCQVAVSAVCAENRSEVCRNTHVRAPQGTAGGRRWQVCAPTRPTRRSPRSRAGGLSGVTVWGQGPLLACAVPVAVTRYAAPLGFESVDRHVTHL